MPARKIPLNLTNVKKGIIYLVGAGPGDPGLITLKAVECLQQADVVVYDYLANKVFLDLAPKRSEKIYVGKKGAFHSKEQEDINHLLIRKASQGKTVVRLKGGDPFIFGRGGEEAEALSAAGISFEVVPGVTSPIAVPAYAGIPLTHRDFTPAVTFVTGHEKEEEGALNPNWEALSKMGTIVFLMGFANLSRIAKHLMEAGRKPSTPVAVIEWGTLPRQKVAVGTLETIVEEVHRKKIKPPTIIVVGEVVSLRKKLSWFEKKPLFGKKILVTRSREQASLLSKGLEEQGAEVIEIPTLEIKSSRGAACCALDKSIQLISKYQWLIFTSVNGVVCFFDRLKKMKKDLRDLKGIQIAAIGSSTAQAIEERGLYVDQVASEFRAEGLIKALRKKNLKGKRILIPRAKTAREILVEELKKLKAKVDIVEVYRTMLPKENIKKLKAILEKEKIDLLVFASSGTVENFVKMAGTVPSIPTACIGPITGKTAKAYGMNVVVKPVKATILALVDAIETYFLSLRN